MKNQWDFKMRCAKDSVNLKFKRSMGTEGKIVKLISRQIRVLYKNFNETDQLEPEEKNISKSRTEKEQFTKRTGKK